MDEQKKIQLSQDIMTFLRDQNAREFHYHTGLRGEDKRVLMKGAYSDDVDFIYLRRSYRGNPMEIGENAEYSGFFVYSTDEMWDTGYYLREVIGDGNSLKTAKDKLFTNADAKAIEIINNRPVRVTTAAENMTRDDSENFKAHGAHDEALSCFYDGKKKVEYTPHIPVRNLTTQEYMDLIVDPISMTERLARSFVDIHAKRINERLWEIGLVNQELAKVWATPGEHQYRKKIADCIQKGMKTVVVHIKHEDWEMSAHMEVRQLTWAKGGGDYSLYDMDAASRTKFEKKFEHRWDAKLYPGMIQAITYGKKTIYTKEG